MANTYYDSQLTAAEIEEVLEAIKGILTSANNGKVLAISNGKFVARSVQWGGGGSAVLEPLSVTVNGDYYPEAGVDGFDEVHVSVSGGGGGGSGKYKELTPLHFDLNTGYVGSSVWTYQQPSQCYSDVYYLQNGKHYLMHLGGTIGNRFRNAFFSTDPALATSNIQGTGYRDQTEPSAYEIGSNYSFLVTPASDGYFAITKTNQGVAGIKTYMFEFDESATSEYDLIQKTITSNGTYIAENENADGYSIVAVDVPPPTQQDLSIVDNGIYYPGIGYGGIRSVLVNVPQAASSPYFGTDAPASALGSDGDYYYQSLSDANETNMEDVQFNGYTSQNYIGHEFISDIPITIVGARYYKYSIGNQGAGFEFLIGDLNSILYTSETFYSPSEAGVFTCMFNNPITLPAGRYIIKRHNLSSTSIISFSILASHSFISSFGHP